MRLVQLGVAVFLAVLASCTFPDVPFIDASEVDGPPTDADIDAEPSFNLTVVRSGAGSAGGTVTSAPAGIDCGNTCSAAFPQNEVVTLSRTLQPGTVFDGWTGACVGTDPTCTFNLNNDGQVTATFSIAQHTISVVPAGNGTGVVTSNMGGINCPGGTCDVTVPYGTQLTLTATPSGLSTFAGWSDVGCTGTGPCTFTVTGDETITASFALDFTLTVSKNGNGHGTVTSSPAGIDCGADCDQIYQAGTMVTLTATPDADSTFTGWTGGGCSGTGTCTVTVDAVVAVQANFTLRRYTLTVSRSGNGGGSVTSTPSGINCGADCVEDYDHGTQVTLTATSDATSTFTGWSDPSCTGTAPCVLTITAARSVAASFTANAYPVTVTRSGAGASLGTVTSAPTGINCGTDCNELFTAGTQVTLTASAASGATFAGWSGGGCAGTGPCVITVAAAATVDASFTLNGYTVSVTRAGTGSALGTVTSSPTGIDCGIDCSEVYTFGQSITLTATAASGATFTGWAGGGCTGLGACVTTVNGDTAITATFTLDSYTLAVVRAGNAAASGSVTSAPSGITCNAAMNDCDQAYTFNTQVTLTAAAGAGSTFGGWSGGGCSGTGSCVVTMNAAKTVTATFTLDEALTVTRAGNGAAFGTVTSSPAGINCGNDCSENFGIGTMVTLTASVATGATFTGWSGACSSAQTTCMVTVSAATNAIATFTLNQYTLTAARSGDGSGSVDSSPPGISCGADCTEDFDHGTMVQLVATPDAGATFTGWTGGGCSGTGTCTVTLTAATTVTANFQADRLLTVTTAGNGTGSVSSSPGGIACPGDCTQTYAHGSVVTLTATAGTGSSFGGWSGAGCSGTGTCVVTLSGARSVQATFTLTTHALTVTKNGSGAGTVTSMPAGINCGGDCNETVNYGSMVTLTAGASAGSTFTGWSGAGCSGTSTCMVTVTAATAVTATFEADQVLTVSLAGGGSQYGLVTSAPAGINCGVDCTEPYAFGSTVTITAAPSPAAAATFDGWSGTGGCTGTAPCTLSMTQARAATATFTKRQYTLTAAKNGNGTGTVSSPSGINCGADCSETLDYGTMVTLTATPGSGSSFTGWAGGGCSGTGSCVTTVTAAATVTATFTLDMFTLDVVRAGDGSGSVASNPTGITCGADCSQPYNHGTMVLLTPTASAGSTFTGWSGGGCSGTGNCTVTVTANTTVTATFQLDRTLTVATGGNGTGSVSSSPAGISCPGDCTQVYAHGQVVILTAAQGTGSTFSGWSGACSGTGMCMVTMDQARSVTASFTLTTHTLTVQRAGTGANSGTITSSPSGINCGSDCTETVNYGAVLTLTATAAAGATFTGWNGGGCSGNGTCMVTVTAATTVTASFELDQTLSISMAGTGSTYGVVTSSPAGINCGADCSEAYAYGTSVTITAGINPTGAATFSGWSGGGCTGTSPCTVSMTQARSVTATFAIASHTLTVTTLGMGSGTVSSTPAGITCGADCAEGYNHGTMVSLSAAAAGGSTFAGWAGACTGTGACNVTMDQAKAVMATFNLNTYTVTVARTTDGAVSGTVTSVPGGINCPGDCSETYVSGTAVTLTAAAAAGATFAGWTTGGCSGTGDCNITVSGNVTVTADFKAHKTLSVTKSGSGTGVVQTMVGTTIACGNDCTEDYAHGTVVTLVATPTSGTSGFGGWTGGGCDGSLMLTCTVTMSQAHTVNARFDLNTYTLTVARGGFGGGTVVSVPAAGGINCGADCTETVAHGGMVTLQATPNAGDIFFGWSGGGCSGTANCTVTVTAATTVTATFDQCNRTTAEVCDDTNGTYEACSAQGQSTLTMTCPLGCSGGGVEKCVDVNPSNSLASYLDMTPNGPDVTFGANSTINTNTGAACNGAQCDAFGTPPGAIPSFVVGTTRVFVVKKLTITGTVKVSGSNGLAFVSNEDVNITGTLDVSADASSSGPGAITGTNACHGGDGIVRNPSPGGGGGGRAGFGSSGGVSINQAGGTGGQNLSDTTLIPLRGGCRGGAAQEEFNSLLQIASGGGGGGAVQIVSRGSIRVTGSGKIDASAGGGQSTAHPIGGGGGGSGGGILLEAPFVVVDGSGAVLSTKGGGGAGACNVGSGAPGQDGGTTAGNAAGGMTSSLPPGGRGGSESLGPTAGTSSASGDTGGGGGSVGTTVIRTGSGSFNTANGAAVRSGLSIHAVQTRLVP